jgi:hypothetical protein
VSPTPSPEDGNRSSFRNVVFSSFLEYRWWTKSKNPVFPSVIHHRQNPLELHCLFIVLEEANNLVGREGLYSVLTDVVKRMDLVRLIKICLNEICDKFSRGKHLLDICPNHNGPKE